MGRRQGRPYPGGSGLPVRWSDIIKQLAPLLLYLRYQARPKQTLIIDEPEMNLHPEGQAKLLEALAMLANLGVNVLLTTHGPYFMARLNNLIVSDSKSSARRARQAGHLYMGDPAAFLAPGDVSAYEMRPEQHGLRCSALSFREVVPRRWTRVKQRRGSLAAGGCIGVSAP